MRSLQEHLIESKKTYPFKIGIAGELPEGLNERLKSALEKFSVVKMSSGKKTPIQERPLDFPQLENTEVTYWDVEVSYPTTDAILKEYLGTFCSVHISKIVVRNPNSPAEEQQSMADEKPYEALLTNPNLEATSAQQSVGDNRVMDLLKELEVARKERDQSSGFKMEALKTDSKNTKSVIGK